MAVDISRFLPQYFEESQQCMREMEQCLAALAGAPVWSGVLADKASRAAHCIKGNSGAFGFEEVAQLAGAIEHVLRKACWSHVVRAGPGMLQWLRSSWRCCWNG
jgi:two-component system chemotaxis sensor kinase CheA